MGWGSFFSKAGNVIKNIGSKAGSLIKSGYDKLNPFLDRVKKTVGEENYTKGLDFLKGKAEEAIEAGKVYGKDFYKQGVSAAKDAIGKIGNEKIRDFMQTGLNKTDEFLGKRAFNEFQSGMEPHLATMKGKPGSSSMYKLDFLKDVS